MKKRFIAALSVLALALALPVAAFAAGSPDQTATNTVTGNNGVVATVSGVATGSDAWVKVTPATANASNVPAGANVVASFEVTQHNTTAPYTFSFTLGAKYAGAKVTVYIQHDEGDPEVRELTADAQGTVSFTMDKLCIISLVAQPTNGAAATTDNGSKSPATGVNTTAAAVVAAVAVAGAACAAVALRKNN